MILDANVLTEPRAWLISKISRGSNKGVAVFTAAQDVFNQHTDKAFFDEDGNVLYWVADWNKTMVAPDEAVKTDESLFSSITSKITASGNNAQIRVGGSKTLTVTFYEDDTIIDHEVGNWSFSLNGEDAAPLLNISQPSANKVKIKFAGGDEYIGSILTITNTSGDIVSSIDVEIIAL